MTAPSLFYSISPWHTNSLIREKQKIAATNRKCLDYTTGFFWAAAFGLFVAGAVLTAKRFHLQQVGLVLKISAVIALLAGILLRLLSIYDKIMAKNLGPQSPEIRKLFLSKVKPNNIQDFDFDDLARNNVITEAECLGFKLFRNDFPEVQQAASQSASTLGDMEARFSSFKLSTS